MNHKILFILVFSAVLCGCSGSAHKNYQGYVEGENIYLASPYSGHLVELLVESGQSIKKNQLLFKLDPEPQKFVIAEASAALEQAKQVYDDLKKPKRDPTYLLRCPCETPFRVVNYPTYLRFLNLGIKSFPWTKGIWEFLILLKT